MHRFLSSFVPRSLPIASWAIRFASKADGTLEGCDRPVKRYKIMKSLLLANQPISLIRLIL